jgi:hypothetical protein
MLLLSCAADLPAPQSIVLPPRLPAPRADFTAFNPQVRAQFAGVLALQAPAFVAAGDVSCVPAVEEATRRQVVSTYSDAIRAGLESILLADGFTLTGPFVNREQMTYGEKDKAILLVVPTLTFTCVCQDATRDVFAETTADGGSARAGTAAIPIGGVIVPVSRRLYLTQHRVIFRVAGSVHVAARLEIALLEPLTGEKMWLKTLASSGLAQPYEYLEETDAVEVRWPLSQRGPYGTPSTFLLTGYDGRLNALASALATARIVQLRQFEEYVAPSELAVIINDARKVRQLKRY